ncbi:hypothetical protein D1872_253830 [compost metagenome]
MQRLGLGMLQPQGYTFGNRAGDMLQHGNPDGRGHQIGFRHRPDQRFIVRVAVQRRHSPNHGRFPPLSGQDDGILPALF